MSGTVTTPPSAAYASTALADFEKADIRRFCGYPVYGPGQVGFQGWRFFQAYGLLEYRMNNLAPAEYQNVRYILAQLYPLESAVWTAGSNLDTDQASVWKHNKQEVQDRTSLSTTRGAACAPLSASRPALRCATTDPT
jgi:hypothetical protein